MNVIERIKRLGQTDERMYWGKVMAIADGKRDPTDRELALLLDMGRIFGFQPADIERHIADIKDARDCETKAAEYGAKHLNRPNEIAEYRKKLADAKAKLPKLEQELIDAQRTVTDLATKAAGKFTDYYEVQVHYLGKIAGYKRQYPLAFE